MPGGSINPHMQTVSSDLNNGTNFTVVDLRHQAGELGCRRQARDGRDPMEHREQRAGASHLQPGDGHDPWSARPAVQLRDRVEHAGRQPVDGVVGDPIPTVAFKIEMTNQGAPDRWDLTTDTGTWTFWRDNGDNLLCMVASRVRPGCGARHAHGRHRRPGHERRHRPAGSDDARSPSGPSATVPETRTGRRTGPILTATAVSLDARRRRRQRRGAHLEPADDRDRRGDHRAAGGGTPNAAVPSAPRDLTVTVQDGQLTAAWAEPEDAGTSAITDYLIEYRA